MDEGKEGPSPKEELTGKLGGRIERDGDGNWTLTLIANNPNNKKVLEELLKPDQFDDHLPTFIITQTFGAHEPDKTEIQFKVAKGPDIVGAPSELAQLKSWKPTLPESKLKGSLAPK